MSVIVSSFYWTISLGFTVSTIRVLLGSIFSDTSDELLSLDSNELSFDGKDELLMVSEGFKLSDYSNSSDSSESYSEELSSDSSKISSSFLISLFIFKKWMYSARLAFSTSLIARYFSLSSLIFARYVTIAALIFFKRFAL